MRYRIYWPDTNEHRIMESVRLALRVKTTYTACYAKRESPIIQYEKSTDVWVDVSTGILRLTEICWDIDESMAEISTILGKEFPDKYDESQKLWHSVDEFMKNCLEIKSDPTI